MFYIRVNQHNKKSFFRNLKINFLYHDEVAKLLPKLLEKKGIINLGGKEKSILKFAKKTNKNVFTKSGIMVGLGESRDEILQVMDDLKAADVDFLTIGQYLQPSTKHYPLDRYYTPKEFDDLGTIAKAKGFLLVSSSPLTRSSYHADEDFAQLQQNRLNKH